MILSLSFSRLTCERRALSLRQVFWWFVASPRHSGVFGEAPLCSAVHEICFGVYFQLLCTQISLKFEIKHEQHLVTFKTTQWTGRRLLIGTLTKSGSMWVTTGLITTSFTIYSEMEMDIHNRQTQLHCGRGKESQNSWLLSHHNQLPF